MDALLSIQHEDDAPAQVEHVITTTYVLVYPHIPKRLVEPWSRHDGCAPETN